jgi:type II secretory pathway component PulF
MGLSQTLIDRFNPTSSSDGVQTYVFEAVNAAGSRVTDRMTGTSPRSVAVALQADGWIPITITVERGGLNLDVSQLFRRTTVQLDAAAAAEFARQLYQLVDAGISLSGALTSLSDGAPQLYAEMCLDLASQVTAGRPMSEALEAYPSAFDEVFRAYVRTGEVTGTLELSLGRLSTMLTKRAEMRNKIKAVTAYPKFVSGAIAIIVTGILMFLVPKFAEIYAQFDAPLPAPTQVVVAASRKFHYVAAIVTAAVFAARRFLAAVDGDPMWDRRIDTFRFARMPLFAELQHKTALFRWASTLGGAMEAGVMMTDALELASGAAGSRWLRQLTPELARSVREGKPLTRMLRDVPVLFPPNVRTMIATGEEVGNMPIMLEAVAAALDSDVDRIVSTLGAKIEVALLVVLGVVVGGLLAVLYLPILGMANAAMQGLAPG